MAATIPARGTCAKLDSAKMGQTLPQIGEANFAIVNKIKELCIGEKAVPTLATWLKLTIKTARNRLEGAREFSLDEVAGLLHSDHGFEILTALMSRAPRKPRWWRICEPLMDLADAEQMLAAARKRTRAIIKGQEETIDALETEIGRAQTRAFQGEEQAGVHADALRSFAYAENRVVAKRRGR